MGGGFDPEEGVRPGRKGGGEVTKESSAVIVETEDCDSTAKRRCRPWPTGTRAGRLGWGIEREDGRALTSEESMAVDSGMDVAGGIIDDDETEVGDGIEGGRGMGIYGSGGIGLSESRR